MIVNIIGRADGFEEGYDAPGEHWAINYWHPKADVVFDVHPDGYYPHLKREHDACEAAGTQLVLHNERDMQRIMDAFRTDYFGSSTDWLIAYALLSNANEIHLWGVSMDDKGDHYERRCATDFWCGYAIGLGAKVIVHGNSTVMTTVDGLTYGTFKPMSRKHTQVS